MPRRFNRRLVCLRSPTSFRASRETLILLAAVIAAAGCNNSTKKVAHLQKTITIAGQPLPAGAMASLSIRPTAPGQGRAAGAAGVNEKYNCLDAPLGKVKVFVDVQHPTGKMITESDGVPFKKYGSLIAPKYTGGIELDITEDNLNQNFDLGSI
jgi:hypothetical protein